MANDCAPDGRIDARGRTVRTLIAAQIDSGQPLPRFAGLRPATANELAPAVAAFEFPDRPVVDDEIGGGSSDEGSAFAVRATGGGRSSWGAPFTRSGWTIDNSVGSADISFKDTGVYYARMEIYRDDDPSDRFVTTVRGAFKSVSAGPSLGADIALPSFTSSKGVIFRGLNGFTPISRINFLGLCGFAFAGGNPMIGGGSLNLFQFNWMPAGPPGMCMGFAFMAGLQYGIPGISAGAGSAVVIPADF